MDGKIIVNFATFPFCFRTVTIKKYTNKLKNEKEFALKFKNIFENLLPHVSQNTFESLINENFHCHIIKESENDKIELIYNIVGILAAKWKPGIDVPSFLEQNLEGEKIWQLGNGSVRMIGIRKNNIFSVLFIDYNPLIYPDVKHNQKDCLSNDYGIIENQEVENE